MRLATLTAAALFVAAPAFAGGFAGAPTCAELAASGQLAVGTRCAREDAVVVVEADHATGGFWYRLIAQRPAVEHIYGRTCPYPHRASDSVFSGGSAYIIKQDVRNAIGCDW